MHPTKPLEAQKVKDPTTQINGFRNPLAVYVARNHGARKKSGLFGVENGEVYFVEGSPF
jgi:hypothetical protein